MAQRPKFRKPNTLPPRVLSSLILIPLSLYVIYLGPPFSIILATVVVIGILIEWTLLCVKNSSPFFKKSLLILIGTTYIAISLFYLFLNFLIPEGWKFIFWLLCIVWSTDISAYVGGRMLKGPKLAPSISPTKTWSGFLCGLIIGVGLTIVRPFGLFLVIFPCLE